MAAKKSGGKSTVKKSAPSKKAPQKSSGAKNAPAKQNYSKKKTRSMAMRIIPYVLSALSLVLAICFIMVTIGGGAGEFGEYVLAFFCALFGVGAFLFPVFLGYIGIYWCFFNVKWDNSYLNPQDEEHVSYLRAKRRIVLRVIMTALTLFMISALIGVIADQSDFDVVSFWDDGIDFEGGGVFGGLVAAPLLSSLGSVVAFVIVIILLAVFALLALGITPDYILRKVRERHIANAQRKAEEKEMLAIQQREAEEQARKAQAQKPKSAAAVAPVPPRMTAQAPKNEETPAREVTVDEIIAESSGVAPAPLKADAAEELRAQSIHIGPSAEQAAKNASSAPKTPSASAADGTPLDFGGDDDFDKGEFSGIDSILKDLGAAGTAGSYVPEKKPQKAESAEPINMTEMQNEALLEDMAAVAPDESDEVVEEVVTPYVFPPIDFLALNKNVDDTDHTEELQNNAKVLVETLRSFRVGIKEVTYSRGPTITRYELKPEVGTRVRSIANLVDDIALNLATSGVRIEAPIPGKAAVGIEVPNQTRATVYLRDLIDTPKFTDSKSKLTAALGMDVGGNPIHFDIGKMPHLLIAGTTGSGKSICINCIIVSILYKAKPEELKLILIDPKKVEFNMYKNIPHLYCPIVSEPKKAAGALASAVAEMERRFELIEQAGVRDIASYNAAAESNPEMEFMPHMVIIIDELADLMMTARDEVETSICRIAQKARAAGIHMILGTQRPSVDVITGLIKANVPSRIACTVMSQVDSRTIIDVAGAENLIGRGDMLFAPVGASKPMRVQGAFVSENEIEKIVTFVKENNGQAKYNTEFINRIEEEAAKCGAQKKGASSSADSDAPEVEGGDSKFRDAVKLAIEEGKISTSLMQRRLGVGYGRAAKMIDTMEEMGYVSKPDGNKPRRVLITMEEYSRRVMDGELGEAE